MTRACPLVVLQFIKLCPFLPEGRQLVKLANRNSLHLESSGISVNLLRNWCSFVIIALIVVLVSFFFFLSRIYMFDSRSWLSTVVRENVSREKKDDFFSSP